MAGKPTDKVMKTIIANYGLTEDGRSAHHVAIGAIGGRKTGMKGFALNRELARTAGKKGGTISRRGNGTKQYQPNTKGYFERVDA